MADRYTLSVAGGSGSTRGRGGDDASPDTDGTVTELQLRPPPLPRQPDPARHRFLGTASSDDDITIKPRALTKLEALSHAITIRGLGGRLRLATTSSSASSSSFRTATNRSTSTTAKHDQGRRGNALLDRFLALPPELQLAVLSYLNFSDLARLRRTCRFFRARVSPPLVRALLAPDFDRHVRHTCRVCLVQYALGAALVVAAEADAAAGAGAEADPHFPLSSRCVGCVWDASGFDVGRKYRMGNDTAVFVCRWCGRPVGAQPAWNQPEFHKSCFKRYTKVVFLYYQLGIAQWVVTIIASGLCWHYFRTRMLWVNAVVAVSHHVLLGPHLLILTLVRC